MENNEREKREEEMPEPSNHPKSLHGYDRIA